MFRTVPLSIIRSFSLYTQQWYMSYRFADSLRAGSGWNCVPSWSCSQAVSKPVWHIPLLCVQWKTPDDGQRNCPKHVQFHSINKFVKLVHLVGFIVRNTWPSSERYKQDYSYNYRSVRTIQFVVINSTVYIAIYLFGWWVTTRLFCAHHPLETAWCTSQQF